MTSKYRSIYLGSAQDPQPTFRDEAEDAANWPEGAVMAITFTEERFGHLASIPGEPLPRTDFLGEDGWPLDLSTERTANLPIALKRGFQVHPWGWRHWDHWTWLRAEQNPGRFARPRDLGPIAHDIACAASRFAP